MTWLRRTSTTGGVVTTTDTWLLHQLDGDFVTDATTASRSLVVSLGASGWNRDLLALFDLDGERLPDIVANDTVIGSTSAFGAEIPVGGVVVDQQAALLAEACFEPGMAKCTFGTGAFLLANTGTDAVRSTSGLTTSVAWRIGGRDTFCVDGQVYTAASAVRWLSSLGVVAGASELDAVAAEDAGGAVRARARRAGAPWWRRDRKISGMTLSTGRASRAGGVAGHRGPDQARLGDQADSAGLTACAPTAGSPVHRADAGLADIPQVPVDVIRRPRDAAGSRGDGPHGVGPGPLCARSYRPLAADCGIRSCLEPGPS